MTPAASTEHRLVHQACPYGSSDEFVSALAPFVREGLERGDPVLAVTSAGNVAALRAELGPAAARDVDFRDADTWYRQPYRTLRAYGRYVDEHADGHVVRVIGEPVWHSRSSAAMREWARYESVLNLAFASSPAWIVCPYDTSALPAHVVDDACRTHPELLVGADACASAEFLPPERLVEALTPAGPARPPSEAASLELADDDLRAVRRFVAAAGRRAGLTTERVDELVLAGSELVANAALHGRRPIGVHVWREGTELVCQVDDAGDGYPDPLTGFGAPSHGSASGRGLWIVRQLCDCVDVLRDDERFAVRMRMGLTTA